MLLSCFLPVTKYTNAFISASLSHLAFEGLHFAVDFVELVNGEGFGAVF